VPFSPFRTAQIQGSDFFASAPPLLFSSAHLNLLRQLIGQLIHLLILLLGHRLLLRLLLLLEQLFSPLLGLVLDLLLLSLLLLIAIQLIQLIQAPVIFDDHIARKSLLAFTQELAQQDQGVVLLGELVAVEFHLPDRWERALDSGGKDLQPLGVDIVVLHAQGVQLLVPPRRQRLREDSAALRAPKRITRTDLLNLGPLLDRGGQRPRAQDREEVVLEIQHLQALGIAQPVGNQMHGSLRPDPVLHHLHLLDAGVQAECLGPRQHRPALQPVAPADHGLEIRDVLASRTCCLLLGVQLGEGVCDQNAGVGTEAVVVEVEMAQRDVRGEEGDERCLHVQAEGVVVEVDGVQVWKLEKGLKKGRESGGDFGEEAAGEDVGEVGDLVTVSASLELHIRNHRELTWRVFFVFRTSASAAAASMPTVFPCRRTSSTSSISQRALMCGSTSAAVSSLRPLPSREKTLLSFAMSLSHT